MQLLEFNIENRVLTQSIAIFEKVNNIVVVNQSLGYNVLCNNALIVPGQSYSIGGNSGEFNHQNLQVTFEKIVPSDSYNPLALAILKRYVNV